MPHIVSSVVKNIDMGEADYPDDKKAEHHGRKDLGKPGGFASGKRQVGGLGLGHWIFSSLTEIWVIRLRATSRLVR